jgi:hypothetical protein
MNKTALVVCLTTFLLGAPACRVEAANTDAVNEVLKLKDAGLGEETVVAFIKGKNVNYDLSAQDVINLHHQGIGAAILNAMLASGKSATPAPPSAPVPQPVQYQTQPVVQPAPVAQPAAVAVPAIPSDAAYFYQELSPYGHWLLAEDNQWYWQPTVAVQTPSWRPYWDSGHWVNTDQGWYWTSDYPWGWAVFHYGRWYLHPHLGWIWLPDRVWGPAWVVWRSGGDYCGWAPLPPGAVYDTVSGGFLFRGAHVAVNFDFGLDWRRFNFCYVREMGSPMRAHWHKEAEIRGIFSRTTVINNYTVRKVAADHQTRVEVINHGIDPAHVGAARGKSVETVRLQDLHTPTATRSPERMDYKTKTLEVYRPNLGESHGGGGKGNGGGGGDGESHQRPPRAPGT